MTTDFRALCAELVAWAEKTSAHYYAPPEVLVRARAALAEPRIIRTDRIEQALIEAECALADIAEGEAEESDGDPLEWAEKRAADALARIRPVMRQHQIQASEWPPVPPTP